MSESFDRVFGAELERLRERRSLLQSHGDKDYASAQEPIAAWSEDDPDRYQKILDSNLCGLSISGGGIRSATFGLGVLQGLAAVGLLPRFDYLSTVSGGGYIGSWL